MHTRTGVAARIEPDAERAAERLAHIVGERHLGALLEVRRQHAERLVRVDAAMLGPRDRLRALERQAAGVREKMANRRARRPRRFVQIDDALLGRDEDREGRHRLRDGRQSHRMRRVAARRHLATWIDDARGSELDGPVVDLAKCLHARRY